MTEVPALRRLPSYRPAECERCLGRDVILVHYVRRLRPWEVGGSLAARNAGIDGARHTHAVYSRARCASRAACDARINKRRDRAAVRGSCLVLAAPAARDAPRGTCRWCGLPIYREDGRVDRRRQYCFGSPSEDYAATVRVPVEGEAPCYAEWRRSRCYDARFALIRTAGPLPPTEGYLREYGPLACADCRRTVWAFGEEPLAWEADHEVPLEDGGEHTLANLRARCVPCHRAKTGRENSERARRRREEAAGQAALA